MHLKHLLIQTFEVCGRLGGDPPKIDAKKGVPPPQKWRPVGSPFLTLYLGALGAVWEASWVVLGRLGGLLVANKAQTRPPK